MHVLTSIRSSGATVAQQSELRNLVLSYTNGGKNPSLKIKLEQLLSQYKIEPNAKPTTLKLKNQPLFGGTRTVPRFRSVTPAKTTPAPSVASSTPDIPIAPADTKNTDPLTTRSSATPQTSGEPITTLEPAIKDVTTDTTSPEEIVTAPAPQATMDSETALARIKVIKSLINEQVGNPVNLIDIDNTTGREYMTAVLEAMKRVSEGGGIQTAMANLETAYTKVEKLLQTKAAESTDTNEGLVATPDVTADVVAAAANATLDTLTKPAVSVPTPAPQPTPKPTPTTTTTAPTQSPQTVPTAVKAPNTPVKSVPATKPPSVTIPTRPDDSAARWAPKEITPKPAATPTSSAHLAKPGTPTKSDPVQPIAVPVNTTNPHGTPVTPPSDNKPIAPLSRSTKPLKSLSDLPTTDSINTDTATQSNDPLFTKEIDEGLQQLLLDWPLFQKSGLLSRGPRGVNHPLFLKMKELQLPVLLAGRFDGSSKEIKQSVTDYMNGWRYEQGIVYQRDETFEHYLRRVIKHIIDLQKSW